MSAHVLLDPWQTGGNLFNHAYDFGREKQIIPTKSIFMPTENKSPISWSDLFDGE